MKITIEIDGKNEMEKLSALFKSFNINAVKVISTENSSIPVIKGDKKIDPKSLFGIWANNPRSLEKNSQRSLAKKFLVFCNGFMRY